MQRSNQLGYEATDVGSGSIVGSYVPVKVKNVSDVYEMKFSAVHMIHFIYITHILFHEPVLIWLFVILGYSAVMWQGSILNI